MKTKTELRRELKAAIGALSAEEKTRQSARLCERLLADPEIRRLNTLGIYLPLPDEPDLRPALRILLQKGVQLALPFPGPENSQWGFHWVHSLTPAGHGPWGLPFPEAGSPAPVSELQTILVPGRGFTPEGTRLGRGKGYYDRLLAGHAGRRVGIGFNCQRLKTLPEEGHDISLTEVWTAV